MRILLEEGDPHAAGQEEEHALGARSADLCDLGRVLVRAQLGVDLAHDLALVEPLVPGQGVLPGGVIWREDEAVGEPCAVCIGACGLVQVVVLPGDVEVIRVASFAGEERGPRVGREVELALLDRGGHDRDGEVRPDDAGQHVHLVALNHLVGELDGDVRLALVVIHDHLDIGAGLLDGEHEAVAHVDAEAGTAAGECRDHADLESLGMGSRCPAPSLQPLPSTG